MYTKSILQWEFFVWSSLRTHYSLYLFILMFWIRTGIFWINHFFILFTESPTFNYCGRLWSGRSFGTNWKGFIGLWSKGPGYIKFRVRHALLICLWIFLFYKFHILYVELRHWSEMLASPRRPVAQWHTLKDIESKCDPSKPKS